MGSEGPAGRGALRWLNANASNRRRLIKNGSGQQEWRDKAAGSIDEPARHKDAEYPGQNPRIKPVPRPPGAVEVQVPSAAYDSQ
jgi:hypothetical protein